MPCEETIMLSEYWRLLLLTPPSCATKQPAAPTLSVYWPILQTSYSPLKASPSLTSASKGPVQLMAILFLSAQATKDKKIGD